MSSFQHISSRRHKDRAAGKPAKQKYSPYSKTQKGQSKQPVSVQPAGGSHLITQVLLSPVSTLSMWVLLSLSETDTSRCSLLSFTVCFCSACFCLMQSTLNPLTVLSTRLRSQHTSKRRTFRAAAFLRPKLVLAFS